MARRPRRPFPAPRPSHSPETPEQTWLHLRFLVAGLAAAEDPFQQGIAQTLSIRIPALNSTTLPHERSTLDLLDKIALDMRSNLGAVRRLTVLVDRDEAEMHATPEIDSDEDLLAEAARRQSVVTLQTLVGTLRRQLRSVLSSRGARR